MAPGNRRDRIIERAGNRCEYCHLAQAWEPFSVFHVEHVIAQQHLSDDSDDNLCLACSHCNLHKGPNLAGIDPDSIETIVPLFHPRRDDWDDHFVWDGALLLGKTAVGKATIHVLAINSAERQELRETLLEEGVQF